jgi:3-oxosteroid 1-dehydrogenase
MERASNFWPDYYDELPGGVKSSRTVTAVTFDKNEIPGGWAKKLRQGFLEYPVRMEDALLFPLWKSSWEIRKNIASTAVRYIIGKLTGKHWVAAGAALQGRLLKVVLEKHAADIRIHSPVSEIIMEDGKAVGVVTEKDGRPWRIGANTGILINAGGFSQNQAMRDKYMPKTRREWSNGIESDTGEMHLEMERIGGRLAQMGEMVGFQITRSPGWEGGYTRPNTQSVTAKPHCIQVDQTGVRYMNECGSYMAFCQTMIERTPKCRRSRAGRSWMRSTWRNIRSPTNRAGASRPAGVKPAI